jgi:flavin reductase (DIM6/NTAB) family NADH-FMN oxidoreductase RutF/rubredoxin
MINIEALFKISYGLYIVSSGDIEKGNGFVCNTVFQVASDPPRFAVCSHKDNFTTQLIQKKAAFSVSVLHKDTSPIIFGKFGYRSGKDFNKIEGSQVKYGITGNPIILDDAVAFLECKVVQTVDVGTHMMFIGELVQAEILDNSLDPLTYQYYRQVKKGIAPKNSPTYVDKSKLEAKAKKPEFKKFKCTACGHIYDEAIEAKRFADLPDNWICPICGAEKGDFIEIQ